MPTYKILPMLGRSPFAAATMTYLVNSGVEFCGMVLNEVGPAATPTKVIEINHTFNTSATNIDIIARAQNLPVLYSKCLSVEGLQVKIETLRPDILLICCYPKILPKPIRQTPSTTCVNLHPSLLPGYRGPSPLFWQLRDAVGRFGVSLHHVSDKVDGGDIIGQSSCDIADGLTLPELETKLGGLGGELMERALLQDLFPQPLSVRQDESQATYQSAPCATDFRLSTSWSARRAYNFLCGTNHYGHSYKIVPTGESLEVAKVLGFSDNVQPRQNISNKNQRLCIQFGPGSVELIGEIQQN